MPIRRKSLREFFWLRVQKADGCWIWNGRKDPYGYGYIKLHRTAKNVLAHRASWEVHFGTIPNGMMVLHRCDNPPCVRPEHLFLGTAADNSHDAQRKGRLNIASKGWLRNRTHCPMGHEFSVGNTYIFRGSRLCRACRVLNQRAYRQRKLHECYSV